MKRINWIMITIAAMSIGSGSVMAQPPGMDTATVTVFPSGDASGNTDHANIQGALQAAAAGGTVRLAAGHFYLNQGVVVTGFSGTLRGTLDESGDAILTTLEAVAPFIYSYPTAYLPDLPWTTDYDDRVMPSVIFFEFPEGRFTVRDVVFVATAPSYVDVRPMWGNPDSDHSTTALTHFIGDFGNDADPSYLNLTFIAGEGDYYGSNVAASIHSMRGPGCSVLCPRIGDLSLHGRGNAVYKRIRSSHVRDYTIMSMWYRDGSIVVEDVVSDTSSTVGAYGLMNMATSISDVDSSESWRSLWLAYIFGGKTRVRQLTSLGGVNPAAFVDTCENVDVRDSILAAGNGFGSSWRAPVFVRRASQNVTFVNNAFIEAIDELPAILVMPFRGNSEVSIKHNFYDPFDYPGDPHFAIVLGSDDSEVVEPDLRPDHVQDLGSNNTIKVDGM